MAVKTALPPTTAGRHTGQAGPFEVRLTLTPPTGAAATVTSARPELVKGLVDGVVCALQTHQRPSTLAAAASRVAATLNTLGILGIQPRDAESLLIADHHAPLGSPGALVHLRGSGVQWNPDDHWCVAAQVLLDTPRGDEWLLSGAVAELAPWREVLAAVPAPGG